MQLFWAAISIGRMGRVAKNVEGTDSLGRKNLLVIGKVSAIVSRKINSGVGRMEQLKTTQANEAKFLTEERLRKYLEYASTDEARAVLFVKKHLEKAAGHWVDIIDCAPYRSGNLKDLEFKLVVCRLFRRIIKPKYPSKNVFTINEKFNENDYYLAVRAITWETAHTDISKQKQKGVIGKQFEIRGVKYNKNKGKFTEKPSWLDSPAWKGVDIHSLRGADRVYVQQFLVDEDWRYEIKSIREIFE